MTYVKINDQLIPATIRGRISDSDWNGRESKAITCELSHAEAAELFVDDLAWAIIYQADSYEDPETGETVTPEAETYDNSAYSVAGPITDHRDGTVTVKMGKPTAAELLAILTGGETV